MISFIVQKTLRQIQYQPDTQIRIRRTSLDFFAILFSLMFLATFIGIICWQFWHANRIYSGISVADVPVGGMTRTAALNHLFGRLESYPLPPIVFTHDGQQWPLTGNATGATANDAAIQVDADLQTAVNQAYLIGRSGNIAGQIREQLVVALGSHNILPPITFNRGQLRHLVSQVASKARRPAQAGSVINDVIVPPAPGVSVDIEASLTRLFQALQTNISQPTSVLVPLAAFEVPAPPFDPTKAANTEPVERLTGDSGSSTITIDESLIPSTIPAIVVQDESSTLRFAIDPAQLEAVLFSQDPPRVERDLLQPILEGWRTQIDMVPRDARLKFNTSSSTVSIVQTSQWGRQLDVDATAQAIEEAVASGSTEAKLVLQSQAPRVDMNRISEMGIRELVASGTSYFKGSSAARIRNIEVAAEKFEGVVIPPDRIFSFNQIVEDVSSANGFEDSLIIWGDRTAVGVGGGVCQVSTTVFRAAYFGGMPIVERYNHGYEVSWYGEPGLDATIYTPNVDFKFRNDTGAYLLIDPEININEGSITFNFYGTKPDRQIVIGEPVATDVKSPQPPTFREDSAVAAGEQKQVEWEKEGKTVTVERKIIENGQERTDTLQSKYQPWQAVFLVAPNTLPNAPSE